MRRFLFRVLGHKAAHKAMERHTRRGGILDIKYGFGLFKDPSVPVGAKFFSLSAGVLVTMLLMAVEAPLELILGLFVPVLGLGADLMIDGLEIVFFPMLIACLVLPRLVRQPTVVRVTAPIYHGEVIDMPPPMLD